jgi:flavin reductase (DIM6/NTAB) family NADH-FMN oxidoreductase RutF
MFPMDFVSLDPRALTPAESYRILVNAVSPRPIALVSTVSAAGIPNLAPFSYFQVGGNSPPSLVFSPATRPDGAEKDTLRNIRETGEYCINVVTREMAAGMNLSSVAMPMDESEWALSAFSRVESEIISPARVVESPVQFECRLFQILEHGSGPGSANYVIGEVVRFHLRSSLVRTPDEMRAIGRLGGDWYIDTATGELFTMPRPSDDANRP